MTTPNLANLDSDLHLSMDEFAKTLIHRRQHISPKRLVDPGPNDEQKIQILDAAGAAPDHGRKTPWHFYEIQQTSRSSLGEMFAAALIERDFTATDSQITEAKQKALRGPLLYLVTANLMPDKEITEFEKLISVGCAIQNVLLMASALGFGCGLSSGKAFQSKAMIDFLKLQENEKPVCFVTIGTVYKHKPNQQRPTFNSYTSII